MDYEDSLIVKTAWYYYIENMTQQKISEKLGISRMKVIKLLEKARQTGVIQFKISPERSQQLMLEQKLTTQWNLKDVFVVPTPPNGSNLNETIAQAAAYHSEVVPAMEALRAPVDKLEMIVDKELWPMPSYGDLIFEV